MNRREFTIKGLQALGLTAAVEFLNACDFIEESTQLPTATTASILETIASTLTKLTFTLDTRGQEPKTFTSVGTFDQKGKTLSLMRNTGNPSDPDRIEFDLAFSAFQNSALQGFYEMDSSQEIKNSSGLILSAPLIKDVEFGNESTPKALIVNGLTEVILQLRTALETLHAQKIVQNDLKGIPTIGNGSLDSLRELQFADSNPLQRITSRQDGLYFDFRIDLTDPNIKPDYIVIPKGSFTHAQLQWKKTSGPDQIAPTASLLLQANGNPIQRVKDAKVTQMNELKFDISAWEKEGYGKVPGTAQALVTALK